MRASDSGTMNKTKSGVHEIIRKRLVTLKRRPHLIPLVILAVAFLYYSLNLTNMSDTTAKIVLPNMGLCQFVIMLFSVLVIVCFMNSFPHRKKTNIPMLVITFVMIGIILYCDYYYISTINQALTRADHPIDPFPYILAARKMLTGHMVILGVVTLITALMPVYSRLLKKINTNIEVDANENMGQIEFDSDDV